MTSGKMTTTTNPRPDLFMSTVNQLLNGLTATRLSEELATCVERARETGCQSELTLTLIIKPVGRDTGQYQVREKIKTKLPSHDYGMTIMFGTPEGNLQRQDPNQRELPLTAVPDDKPEHFAKIEENQQ